MALLTSREEPGGHGRQSHVVLALRNAFRRKLGEYREAVALRPAVVRLQLGRDVQEDAVVGGIRVVLVVLRPEDARREKDDRQQEDTQPSHRGCSVFRRVRRSTHSTRTLLFSKSVGCTQPASSLSPRMKRS